MKIAFLSPLPPVKSGIAIYSVEVLRGLAKVHEVTAVVDQEPPSLDFVEVISYATFRARRSGFDAVICQLGNNPFHEFVYREAMEHPSFIVLHDIVLHHLIAESTLSSGDGEGYVEAIAANHGDAGRALAEARSRGIHHELGYFLYPSSIEVAKRSRGVIVHNRYAARTLRSFGVATPITVASLPQDQYRRETDRGETRTRTGYRQTDRIIGVVGFVTAAKRPGVIFEAFARANERDRNLRLLFIGEPSSTLDLSELARSYGVLADVWRVTGFVSDEELIALLEATDRVVNLRYPSAGETSGALMQILAAGKPVAVSNYAQFADLPSQLVTKIDFGPDEVRSLAEFLLAKQEAESELGTQRQRWVQEHCSLEGTLAAYARALRGEGDHEHESRLDAGAALPLFPSVAIEGLSAVREAGRWAVTMNVRNDGAELIRCLSFGQPGFSLIAKLFDGDSEVTSQWISLSGDLRPAGVMRLDTHLVSPATVTSLRLYAALEGVPDHGRSPLASLEISS